jgi:hypothetical protein
MDENSPDPKVHVQNIRTMLTEAADHARRDVGVVHEPQARALFETTAEVLGGLIRAYDHYAAGEEEAWKAS